MRYFYKFIRRHPELLQLQASTMPAAHKTITTEEEIRKWFRKIQSYFDGKGLSHIFQDPTRIWNLDETSVLVSPPLKDVPKGRRETRQDNNEVLSHSVMFTASAAGTFAPPLVLFSHERRIPSGIIKYFPEDWTFGQCSSAENFYEYISNSFYNYLLESQIELPVILFLDVCKSHLTLELTKFCSEHQIIIIVLSPNCTHILQPLDVTFLRAFNASWADTAAEWRMNRKGEKVPLYEFAPLLKKAFDKMTEKGDMIKKGFLASGIWPFNENAPKYETVIGAKRTDSEQASIEDSD